MADREMSETARFCFVILHYKTIDETIKCIESIESVVRYRPYDIVVVDNGSGDGTGQELVDRYCDDPLVTVLLLPENLGFARGNNAGYTYAKEHLGCSYLAMLNSDVLITQPDMCERVKASMDEHGCSVLGPKIVNPDASILGPHTFPGIDYLALEAKDMRLFLRFAKHGVDITPLIRVRGMVRARVRRTYREQAPHRLDATLCHQNAVIEGCCLFFGPDYLRRFDGLDERTFLYHEEDLLYLRLQRNGMSSCYDPSISIVHNHHATTRSLAVSELEHKVFRYTHQLRSRKVLMEEMSRDDLPTRSDT